MSGHRGVGWGGKKITQTADFMYFPCAECKETRLQKWRFWRLVDYVNYPDQDRYTYCRSTSMCIYIYIHTYLQVFVRFLKSIYVPLEGMICLKRQSSWVGISGFLLSECVGNPRTQWWICGACNWFFCEASGPFLKLIEKHLKMRPSFWDGLVFPWAGNKLIKREWEQQLILLKTSCPTMMLQVVIVILICCNWSVF